MAKGECVKELEQELENVKKKCKEEKTAHKAAESMAGRLEKRAS